MTHFYELLQISLSTREHFTTLPTREQWESIYKEAERQCVLGVMFAGVEKVVEQCGGLEKSNLSHNIFLTWYICTQKIKERNHELDRKSVWLQKWLSSQGFNSCILKGQGNALIYPDPSVRTGGDIDVWMWMRKYDSDTSQGAYMGSLNRSATIQWVLSKMGIDKAEIAVHHIEMDQLGGVEIEGHYWPSFFFSFPRMRQFEHYCEDEHLRQMNNWKTLQLQSSKDKDDKAASKSAAQSVAETSSESSSPQISVPTPEFNMILQLLHVMRHLFSDGIGMKQMIDFFWLIHSEEFDKDEVRRLVSKFSLTHIAEGMMWILHSVCGMPAERLPFRIDETIGQIILDDVIRGGNMGHGYLGHHMWRFKSKLHLFVWRTYRNLTLIRICPSEVLWSPFFRIWQKLWIRKMKREARRKL